MNLKTFYHWSPTSRRASILEHGLLPGSRSTDDLWNPPEICLADSAHMAWRLSGGTTRGAEIASWDLWEVWVLNTHYRKHEQEFRVATPIDRRNVVYVATRVQTRIINR
jgi:hypothetical protein